jgi:transposase InsO family protein
VFDESRRTYGAPRVAKTLRRKRGQPVATKRIARLMSELGLQRKTARSTRASCT